MKKPVLRKTFYVLRLILLLSPVLAIAETEEGTKYPFTFLDDLERKITLSTAPKRLISIGPANTEILFAIEAGKQVVGVDQYSDYPAEAKLVEQVGGLVSPAYDKIVALMPDLVIVGMSQNQDVIDKLVSLGLNAALIVPSNLNEIYETTELMGQICNRLPQAKRAVSAMKTRVKAVQEAVAKVPDEKRLRVFYELWPDPLRSAGPGSFIHNLIVLAGGSNIASDTLTAWPHFSLETLIERDPQVIFTTREESQVELLKKERKAWTVIEAVRTGRIYLLDEDEISRPGPRAVSALEAIAQSLYPKRFKKKIGEKKIKEEEKK